MSSRASSVVTGYPVPPVPPPTVPYESYSYTRIFQPRLLGYPGPIHTPSTVTSYDPDTGLSRTTWTFPDSFETYIDPACILLSIGGHYHTTDRSLSWAVHYGPGSKKNRSGRIPPKKAEKTRARLHAELYAAVKALEQVKEIIEETPEIRNIVIATDSRRIIHGASACVVTWKQNHWTRAGGRKPVPNAQMWQKIVGVIEELEAKGVGVRFWEVNEHGNQDALSLSMEASKRGGHTRTQTQTNGAYGQTRVAYPVPAPGVGLMSPTNSTYSASSAGEHRG